MHILTYKIIHTDALVEVIFTVIHCLNLPCFKDYIRALKLTLSLCFSV